MTPPPNGIIIGQPTLDFLVNSPWKVSHLSVKCSVLRRASCGVNFWGTRVVTVPNYEGSVELNQVTRRVVELARKIVDEQITLSTTQMIKGIGLILKLLDWYKQTDKQLDKSNVVTKTMNYFLEWTSLMVTDRLHLKNILRYSTQRARDVPERTPA